MPESLNSNRLLFDLHQIAQIAQTFSGCLEPEVIAHHLTEGLIQKFGIALARVWLLEENEQFLKLVASSGMYSHTNGGFSRVPLGAYKVGKIAQNRISFLSNNLAEESWVGNREWAIANHIRGFVGYPLMIRGRVLGVLANFSREPLAPEFLEILQTLCTMTSLALDAALQYQQEKQVWSSSSLFPAFSRLPLSEQLATILSSTRLTLVGAERSLSLPITYVFLQTAEILNQFGCAYCCLSYQRDNVSLEAIVPTNALAVPSQVKPQTQHIDSIFGELFPIVSCLGGIISKQFLDTQRSVQLSLSIPYTSVKNSQTICIKCKLPILQTAFTHLAFLAGLTVSNNLEVLGNIENPDAQIPLLTDDISAVHGAKYVIWIQQANHPTPSGVQAKIDLAITPEQLCEVVNAVMRGESWGLEANKDLLPLLSERELEIMQLLAKGLRDRAIAKQLVISESTVKFHINNILAKLKAKTRLQALHIAIVNDWILL
ncbi:LuxR C-terminal-related transcriptional regulator [Pseudanabaena sp. ABRG5-3]|uniref:LuxR C-terminal-related transcriptional regulator n=1 Tax=Pseudanabaena sp. ABRG5-3 TaxID=685565 RepID=UPI000DC72F39|nr:LuxR C-terminal-related transcriptional regulator [Pseudanabaena sp. ABRG5-3]BBC26225.1 hypothetical protein ABRG53_3968 [Pseudanabaena sp. ABRG5-3]